VNIEGEVIGMNTLIRGLHTGIGFAIPSSLAREVSDKLISDGKFTRAWLGVRIQTLNINSLISCFIAKNSQAASFVKACTSASRAASSAVTTSRARLES